MRFFLFAQLALCVAALAVVAAPIPSGQIDELVRRINPANIKVEPNVGKKNAGAAKACVEAYCNNNVPSAQSATVSTHQSLFVCGCHCRPAAYSCTTVPPQVFDNLHSSKSDGTPHYTTSVKDGSGNYINGFAPGTTPDAGQKAPMHHVDASGNPTPAQSAEMTKNGGSFPI